jgi:hypothetical protein
MGALTNAFDSFGASGVREDLADFISTISPEETPFVSNIGTTKSAQRQHVWQTDTLAAAAANAVLEAEAYAAAARTPTNTMTNNCQHFVKQFMITDTMDVVNTAGRAKESAYQLVKAGKELKRDFEFSQFANTSGASGYIGLAATAPTMTNMSYYVINVTGNTGYSGVQRIGQTQMCATALTTITELCFNLILQDIWDEGGRPNAVYVGGKNKRLMTDWGTSSSRVWDGSKKITNAVDVYESDFGILQLKLDRYCFSAFGYILDESLWKRAELHPTRRVEIGRTGLGSPFMLHAAWTLEARNPTGNGWFSTA